MEQNLDNRQALKKFKELVEEINICMFITNTSGGDEHTRPMATMRPKMTVAYGFIPMCVQ